MFSDGGDDVLAAFDEASGKELWRIRIAERYKGINGSFDGPISTPAIAGGRVFALGPAGQLLAADLANGRELWRVDLPSREGASKPELGFASSPVVAGGVLVVQIGARRAAPSPASIRRPASDAGAWATTSSSTSRRSSFAWVSATSWSRSVTRG